MSKTRRRARRTPSSPYLTYGLLALAAATVLVVALRANSSLSPYTSWLAGWSVAAFFLYGFDKYQAQRGAGRVPELVLLAMAAAGGFGGALLAMVLFHHKTNHLRFWIVLVLSLLAHAFLVAYGYVG